jgi:hypothetical protein
VMALRFNMKDDYMMDSIVLQRVNWGTGQLGNCQLTG